MRMEKGNWFAGPDWLLDKRRWPEQPRLNGSKETDEESKVIQEAVLRTQERTVCSLSGMPSLKGAPTGVQWE